MGDEIKRGLKGYLGKLKKVILMLSSNLQIDIFMIKLFRPILKKAFVDIKKPQNTIKGLNFN